MRKNWNYETQHMRDFIWGNKGGIRLELDSCGIPLFCRKISLRVEADTFTSHKVLHSAASLKLSNTNDLKQRIFFVKHLFGIPILFTKYGLCLPNESSAQTETWWWQLQDSHICEYDQNHWKMNTWRYWWWWWGEGLSCYDDWGVACTDGAQTEPAVMECGNGTLRTTLHTF